MADAIHIAAMAPMLEIRNIIPNVASLAPIRAFNSGTCATKLPRTKPGETKAINGAREAWICDKDCMRAFSCFVFRSSSKSAFHWRETGLYARPDAGV